MQCQPGSGQAGVEQTGVSNGCCCAAAAALPVAPSHRLGARPNHIRFVVCTKFWLLSAYSSDNELIQLTRRVPSASSSPSSDFIDLYVLLMQIPLVIMSSTVFYLLISLLSLVQLAKGSLSLSLFLWYSVKKSPNVTCVCISLSLSLSFEIQPNSARILCSSCCAMAILISIHSTVISCYGKHVRESILAFSSSPGEFAKDRKCSSWWNEWNFDSPVKVPYIALI